MNIISQYEVAYDVSETDIILFFQEWEYYSLGLCHMLLHCNSVHMHLYMVLLKVI